MPDGALLGMVMGFVVCAVGGFAMANSGYIAYNRRGGRFVNKEDEAIARAINDQTRVVSQDVTNRRIGSYRLTRPRK